MCPYCTSSAVGETRRSCVPRRGGRRRLERRDHERRRRVRPLPRRVRYELSSLRPPRRVGGSAPVDGDDLDRLLEALQLLGPRLGHAERGSRVAERLRADEDLPPRAAARCAPRRAHPGRRSRRTPRPSRTPPARAPIRTSGATISASRARWIATAAAIAAFGLSKEAKKPSPVRLTTSPPLSTIRSRTSSSCRASSRFHLSSPSVSRSLVESTMSVNRNVLRVSSRPSSSFARSAASLAPSRSNAASAPRAQTSRRARHRADGRRCRAASAPLPSRTGRPRPATRPALAGGSSWRRPSPSRRARSGRLQG